MSLSAITTIFGNTIYWSAPVQKDIDYYRVFRRSDTTTPSDSDYVGQVPHSPRPHFVDLFSNLNNTTGYRYYLKSVSHGDKSSAFSIAITAVFTTNIQIGSTAHASVSLKGTQITIESTSTAVDTQSKTWTSKADFDLGTLSNLSSDGNELSLLNAIGSWAAGGALSSGRRYLAGCGTQGAGLSFGGYTGAVTSETEEYNGTTWGVAGVGNLGTARYGLAGCGTQGAGLAFGGLPTAAGTVTEEYDGTTWSVGGSMSLARQYLGGSGTQAAGLAFGGYRNGAKTSKTEEYAASVWSTGGNLITPRYALAGAGTQGAGLAFGGLPTAAGTVVEKYSGTNWSTDTSMSVGRRYLGGAGLQASALAIGGFTGTALNTTEEFNGSTWASGGNLSTAKYALAAAGTQASGLAFGGLPTAAGTVTEEYTQSVATSGTWTVDQDASASSSWENLSWNKTGGSVQTRCKSATAIATLGAASWVPSTGYYTASPVNVTAADNRYFRLEFALSGGATVQDVTQEWTPTITPGITLKGQVSIPFQQVSFIPTGFENRTDSVMSFNDGTRTLSISPAVTSFSYWHKGEKFTKTAASTIQPVETSRISLIYFNGNTLSVTSNETSDEIDTIFREKAPVALLYWNTADSTSVFFGEERHGIQMDGKTHQYLHRINGAQIRSGLGLTAFTADQSGNNDPSAQFGVAVGILFDEDIANDITAVSETVGLTICYRDGVGGNWRVTSNAGFSILTNGTARMTYNQESSGTWSLTEIGNNDFGLCHVYASNDLNSGGMLALVGQGEYNTIGQARSGATTEINSISLGALPGLEMRAIGTIIFQTSNSYGNGVRSRVRSNDTGDDWIDWRSAGNVGVGGLTTDHGSLGGLSDNDHPQYLHITQSTAQTVSSAVSFSSTIHVSGTVTVSEGIIAQEVIISTAGQSSSDGAWRWQVVGNDLQAQRYGSGVWTHKGGFTL